MKKSTLIIPVAAMAVMATNAYAFNTDVLKDAGLSDDQIAAFEAAHELREEGDRVAAREVLTEAGIDQETMHDIREAVHEERHERREAVKETVDAEDFDAFVLAAAGSPLEDKITSEADFERLIEAHKLREAGDRSGAREILSELGIEKPGTHGGHGHRGGWKRGATE